VGATFKRSHAERRLANGGNGGGLTDDLDPRRSLSAEQVQQELAGRSDEPSRRMATPGSHSLICPGPLELESYTAQATSKKPRGATNVAPQGGAAHCSADPDRSPGARPRDARRTH